MNRRKDDGLKINLVRSTIRMLIPLDKQSEALDILGSVRAQAQFEHGCISYRLYRGADESRAIMVDELWASHEEVVRHLKSDVYRRVLLVIEMSEEPPEIRFDEILRTSGMEAIEKVLRI